jgi:hypothetical protein
MKFYRYQENIQAAGGFNENGDWYRSGYSDVTLSIVEFILVKETPKGHWIQRIYETGFNGEIRWISKTSRKRYAYPTLEEALNSFIIRKKAQVNILKEQLTNAKKALTLGIIKQKQKL